VIRFGLDRGRRRSRETVASAASAVLSSLAEARARFAGAGFSVRVLLESTVLHKRRATGTIPGPTARGPAENQHASASTERACRATNCADGLAPVPLRDFCG
jgi:hypothetical protein